MAQVVEHQQGIGTEEDGFGESEGVFFRSGHPGLEVTDGIVGHVADGSAVEAGQFGKVDHAVTVHFLLHGQQRVDGPLRLAGAALQYGVGLGADEAVAS